MPATVKAKDGRVLTDSDIERMADEAKRGFVLLHLDPSQRSAAARVTAGSHSPQIAVPYS